MFGYHGYSITGLLRIFSKHYGIKRFLIFMVDHAHMLHFWVLDVVKFTHSQCLGHFDMYICVPVCI